jgi:RNA polymerase sigma factor (sigma-70 family)
MLAFGIARHIRLELRKISPLNDIVPNVCDADSPSVEDHLERLERIYRLRWAVSKLTETEQEVILLLLDKELRLEEISVTLEIPIGTIKSHVHRAKYKLKQFIQEFENGRSR